MWIEVTISREGVWEKTDVPEVEVDPKIWVNLATAQRIKIGKSSAVIFQSVGPPITTRVSAEIEGVKTFLSQVHPFVSDVLAAVQATQTRMA